MCNELTIKRVRLLYFIVINLTANAQSANDKICGRWESSEKNLIVDVYRSGNDFKAKIIWFRADNEKQMEEWTDENNPDAALKQRKLLGINVLDGLVYMPESNSWEDGMVYDAKHGRYWNASAYIDTGGLLKVKGYWHFKFIGRTMTFNRL